MAEQYWIGGFYIDASRNQISHNKDTQLLPPKALAVLTYLAENQGKVVSQEELLSQVWKGTIVSSNTLQRCIAQLRKALGDDGKSQDYIKTHAKRGYSLESDVRWQTNDNPSVIKPQTISDTKNTVEITQPLIKSSGDTSKKRLSAMFVAPLFLVVGALFVYFYSPKSAINFSIKNITPLTSTDNRELASMYSPDGKYVVFKRFPEVLCTNNLWAKNMNTQEEFQLTKELGAYESVSFSKDGKTLAFVKEHNCGKPVTQKHCFQLQSLDFAQALGSPQTPNTLMECKNSEIRSVKWLNHDEIALLQNHSHRWQLNSYSISNDTSKTLYALDEGNLIGYDYSPTQDLIAVTSIHSDGQYYIETLKPNGQLMTSHLIQYPNEIPKFRHIYPNFSSIDNQLIFSTGRQLFTLSYQGQITNISLPLDEAMGSPVFHPDGKRMLAIKGHYDSDIVSVPLSQFAQDNPVSDENSLDYTVIGRSILGEDNAKHQPIGGLVAFSSERSGNFQIWLAGDDTLQQLSHFPIDTYIYQLAWADDGKSVLVNVSNELKRISLDGDEVAINLPHPVHRLFHWDSYEQTALATMLIQGVKKFVEINLSNTDIRIISDKRVEWAVKSENGQLIYMDHMDRFWQPEAAEDQLITALEGQGSNKRFIIKDDVIYGINDDFQLWSFALNDMVFHLIGNVPPNIDYITDMNQQRLLMTMRIAARKEVVELSLH